MVGAHPFHMAGDKYITAVRDAAGALPLLIPVLADPIPPAELLAAADGFLFTGSPSNVAPARYAGEPAREGMLLDENRDATNLPLLRAAIAGAPVLCICRGFQELNVAFGGNLLQLLHEAPGRSDHREDCDAELDMQYGPAHEVRVSEGGLLTRLVNRRSFPVNSLHAQGIDRLAPRLHADAAAPDGTIEAVSMPEARGFLLGVQWHPEWRWRENDVSRAILGAFGEAVRERACL
jgi:putative glutamine amidotransferase